MIDEIEILGEIEEALNMSDWKSKLSAEALEKKRERDREYNNRVRSKTTTNAKFSLAKGSKYEEIYKSIPNKAEWFRECLEKYEKEHNN